jgi:hypothetical protein
VLLRATLLRAPAVLAALLMSAGCTDYSQLAFRQDSRLSISSPRSHELVTLPLALTWSMRDFEIVSAGTGEPSKNAGHFALFVDKAPIRPGHTLRDIAGRDTSCDRDPSCPDDQYLADRGVYTTAATSFELLAVAPLTSKQAEQLHDVTIVLLDSAGRRIGESSWHVQFKLRKRTFG